MRTLWMISGVVTALLFLFVLRLPQPRIVARAIAPDGTDMRIVQQSDLFHELPWFHTYFVYRKTNGQWRGFQYDHEDNFWFRSKIVLDTNKNTASFLRDARTAIIFDWTAEDGSRQRLGSGNATLPGNAEMRSLTNYSGSVSGRVRL